MMRDFSNAKQCCQHALNVAAKYGALPKTVAKIYSRLATCEKEDRHFLQGKKESSRTFKIQKLRDHELRLNFKSLTVKRYVCTVARV